MRASLWDAAVLGERRDPPGSGFRALLGKTVPLSELPPQGSDSGVLAGSGEQQPLRARVSCRYGHPEPCPVAVSLTSGRLDAHPHVRTADPESVSGRKGHRAAAGGGRGQGSTRTGPPHGTALGTLLARDRCLRKEEGGAQGQPETRITSSFKAEGADVHGHPDTKGDSLDSHLGSLTPRQTRAGVGPGCLGEPGLRVAGSCQGLWRGFQEKKDITNHGGLGVAWARGWQRAGPTWPVSAGGIGRQARGLLAAGQEARGRGVSPGPLSGARMGATPLLAAPGRITSPLLAPLQNGHGRSELQGLARVTGRSLCRVRTARGAVRARGRRGSALPTCTVGSSCVHRCPVFPARWPLPGLHVKPLRSLEGSGPSPETSMYLAWGGAGHAGRSLTAAQVSLMGSLDEPVAQLGALPKPGRLTRGPGWDPGSGFHQVPSDAEAAPHAEVLGPKQAWARDCLRAAGRGACPERQAVCWAKAWDPG